MTKEVDINQFHLNQYEISHYKGRCYSPTPVASEVHVTLVPTMVLQHQMVFDPAISRHAQ